MSPLDFSYWGSAVGYFTAAEYPRHDGRYPYEGYRSPIHLMWYEELQSKKKARCYYDTEEGRVYFTTQVSVREEEHWLVDLSEFRDKPWAPVTSKQTCRLADILFAARSGSLPPGRIFLSDEAKLFLGMECLFLSSDEPVERDEPSIPAEAMRRGFRRPGLSTDEMKMVVSWARDTPRHRDHPLPSVDELFMWLGRLQSDALPPRPPPSPRAS